MNSKEANPDSQFNKMKQAIKETNVITTKESTLEFQCFNGACKEKGTIACRDCQVVHYCSKKCQQNHYKYHKDWCFISKGEAYKPLFTNTLLSGHDKDDLIIVYSTYEDFTTEDKRDPSLKGLIFPQWFCTNCANEESAISIPATSEKPILGGYEQIETIARKTWKKISKGKEVKNVHFFHTTIIVTMNGNQPFKLGSS